MLKPELIEHSLAPIFDERSRILILGTMPSPKSREVGFYYGHPQNRFWKVMGALFNEPEPVENEERRAFLLEHGIALWDILASCTITGASDASITNPVPNDLTRITTHASLTAVCTTGKTASTLYQNLSVDMLLGVPHISLPSTSTANARMRLNELIEAYQPLVKMAR